jgi:hypothetical protein
MLDIVDNPVLFLTWHVLLIKHWFSTRREASSSGQNAQKRRRIMRDSDSRRRLHSWDSVFGKDILLNSNIQNPRHRDGEKFRLRFRVSELNCLFECDQDSVLIRRIVTDKSRSWGTVVIWHGR